jgi:integrase
MALRWADVNLDKGTALSRAADNKGKRDQLIPLHPLVVDHLRSIKSFSAAVFPWKLDKKDLYAEFYAIQDAAKVKPEHGKARYGFHDFRRAFATLNAENLTADALQMLMQHKSYTTTQKYINMARQANQTVAALFVPDVTTDAATG